MYSLKFTLYLWYSPCQSPTSFRACLSGMNPVVGRESSWFGRPSPIDLSPLSSLASLKGSEVVSAFPHRPFLSIRPPSRPRPRFNTMRKETNPERPCHPHFLFISGEICTERFEINMLRYVSISFPQDITHHWLISPHFGGNIFLMASP